jgi:hypothetical protein
LGKTMQLTASPARLSGFVPLGIFFFFGSLMATYAAITLAIPGTFLDKGWELNKSAHVQLAATGRIMAVPFAFLSVLLFLAGVGWFRRRRWGWVLGVTVIAVNLTGDLIHLALGDWLGGAVGIVIAGLLLIYITRSSVRSYFR